MSAVSDGIVWGFTGTQRGMTPAQRATVRRLLEWKPVIEAHHGDCIGADAEFDEECEALGIRTVIHPPSNPSKRAWCFRLWSMQTRFAPLLGKAPPRRREVIELPPRPYLARNKDIVAALVANGALMATPFEDAEQLRSGTWATLRECARRDVRNRLIAPNGNASRYQ